MQNLIGNFNGILPTLKNESNPELCAFVSTLNYAFDYNCSKEDIESFIKWHETQYPDHQKGYMIDESLLILNGKPRAVLIKYLK